MESILIIGIIVFAGFIFAEVCTRFGLPKVTGYILAGVFLNPNLTHFIPEFFVEHTNFVTNIALSFITFSVGGTLFFPKVRSLGKAIMLITFLEAEFAFLFVAIGFILIGPLIFSQPYIDLLSFFIPLSLLIASMASPTDPSATLAIVHQYRAEGDVTSTIMGVAAFDDILGIINYSLAGALSVVFIMHKSLGLHSIAMSFVSITGSIILGSMFGIILNLLTKIIKKETEGVLITLIISLLSLCYGLAGVIDVEELLSTMTMGIVVINYNVKRELIFRILERYTEELIFVLFFTISAMHLDFKVLISNSMLILLFVVFRAAGKICGTFLGGTISKASAKVKSYAAGGLIPQGGIVIGLALLIKQNPVFDSISGIIMNVIIGATIIHEIIGPIISKVALEKAGEISIIKR